MSEFTDWERGQMYKESAKRARRPEIEVLVCNVCLNEVEPDEYGDSCLIECDDHQHCGFIGCRDCFKKHAQKYSENL